MASRQASERSKVVEAGSSTAMVAMRRTNDASSASAETSSSPAARRSDRGTDTVMPRRDPGAAKPGRRRSAAARRARTGTTRRPCLHQHADAVAADGPVSVRPADEPSRRRPVHHVDCQRAGPQDVGTHRHTAAGDAAGRRIDDDVEALAARIERCGPPNGRRGRRRGGMPRDQCLGPSDRAVGDDDLAHAGGRERADHAGCATAGADEKQPCTAQCHAGVDLDVADQSRAVGVVAGPAVGIEAQGVAGAGQGGSRCRRRDQPESLELEGQRDVATARSGRRECSHRRGEGVDGAVQALVDHGLARLPRELGMDERRPAVLDRVAGHRVAIHGWFTGERRTRSTARSRFARSRSSRGSRRG